MTAGAGPTGLLPLSWTGLIESFSGQDSRVTFCTGTVGGSYDIVLGAFDDLGPDISQCDANIGAVTRPPLADIDFHGATRADIVLAAFAVDAIELLTGPRRAALRACGAPGCVLLFLKDHPRKEWCSAACGNRARQARHYARTRDRSVRD